jgi:hypothetical protein
MSKPGNKLLYYKQANRPAKNTNIIQRFIIVIV